MPDGGFNLQWRSPGPVALAFFQSRNRVDAIMGPIGGAKTTTCFFRLIYSATQQAPGPDGVRRFRFCVVRDTYRQLWKTTIASWNEWVPKSVGVWTGSTDGPATHKVRFRLTDQTLVDLWVDFVAIGEHKVEDILRGYEVTAFYLNEADRLFPEVLTYCLGRAGRYPKMVDGGPTWYGVIMDFNAPDVDAYLYDLLVENKPDEWGFFQQPSGLSAQAENLENLPPGYYENQMTGQPDWYIRRMIKNQFGFSRDGKPVYPEYNDALHCAAVPLVADERLPLILGLDAGGTPAATFWQHLANGQWRGLRELVVTNETTMGPSRFGDHINQVLRDEFPGFRVEGHADPSAAYGADKDNDEKDWIQIVAAKTKFAIRPAPTNNLSPRLEAVRLPLTRMIDGHVPGLIISPVMKIVRKGFNSGYRYKRMQVAEGRYEEKPEKNDFSHPHDSGQYALLGGGEYLEVMGRAKRRQHAVRQTHAIDDDNPRGLWTGGRHQQYSITD